MDGLGRPAPFPSVGAGAGPIVPPPHGIVFGRAAAGAAAHPVQNGGSNRNVSPSRNRKVPPVVAKQQQPVPKQQQAAPPKASVKNSELLREEQAKARRLLRFAQAGDKPDSASGRLEERVVSYRELRQPKGELVVRQTRAEAPRRPQGKLVDFAAHDEAMEMEGPEALGDDFRNVEAIIGTCTDMCPEPERQERERKGDLDRFERVDGDRNLTSVNLAVKKYTRTASREPPLIRPLPVLQMTMDHLLTLINQGYSEELLKIHSFLWDRMRAVRMDLRMQHIFNREAITMHEQMIRFHILAMHELCEFAKGEGFNEGFDAHLNIEQMNKASVDLFEMYDDHRKRGIPVPTEAEFRGYYALLKLDKHPGYSVEPAELSLDLAKMTSEMRNTPQVLFAREVARACRGGNYIAFFRLARKATYLQACLMHAHFSKVRTEALAVLHSGLQRNQSIPIMVVTKWLAMEGEDIEALMEYHGFTIKVFEKTYAVKEGPFLNRDAPYHAQRSRLVEAKRSLKVELDVEGQGQDQAVTDSWTVTPTTPVIHEEEMPDYEDDALQSPEESKEEETWENTVGRGFLGTSPGHQEIQTVGESRVSPTVKAASPSPGALPEVLLQAKFPFRIRSAWPAARKSSPGVNSSTETNLWRGSMHKTHSAPIQKEFGLDVEESDAEVEEDDDDMPESHPTTEELRAKRALEWEVEKEEAREKDREQERRRRLTEEAEAAAAKWAAKQAAAAEAKRLEAEERKLASHRSEASAGRMRLWLRRWKRRATFRAEEKVRRRKKAEAALSSLSAGPALVSSQLSRDMVLTSKTEPILSVTSLSQVARERGDKLWEMWRPLDIASVVIPLFEQRIPVPRFITFKLLLSVGEPNASNSAGQWLHTKLSGRQLLPPEGDSLGFWFEAKDMDLSREKLGVTDGYGASGLVFLLREGHPISEERARLLAVVQSLPVGARVPLLLVFTPQRDTFRNEEHRFRGSLGLEDLDRTRIACHYISPTFVKSHGNTLAGRGLYSDHYLKEGLVWLANNMPSQPNLVCQHIRDVVLNNLDGHLKLLSVTAASKVSPEQCVLIFNHALESAMSRIRSAVDSAPPHWPPPEVDAEVNGLLSQVLPQQGWNDPVNLDPIFTALRLAQLPPFPTMKQLRPGSPTSDWENVRHQKAIVEHSLRQYLGLLDGTGQESAATIRQAQLMVQRACSLEWTASGRVLVPRWASIFQAVYQARLLLLNSEPPPIVFVLAAETEHHLELDDFEQSIPFANDIVAGSSFAFPPHASLILNDFVEKPEVEPRSNHNGSTEPFGRLGPELEGTREEPLISYRTKRDAGISSPGCGWSVSSTSPNDDIRQVHEGKLRRQPNNDFFPNTLKKRKLTLSPEIIVNSVPTTDVKNSANESSVLLNHKHRFNSSQEMASNRGTLEDYEDNSFRVHRRLKLPLTAEEIEIENMVVKIQTDVDRSVRRASSDMCFADTLFTSDIRLVEGDSLSMDAAQSMTVNFHVEGAQERNRDVGNHLPSWTWLNGGVKDLEDLLIQCWRAQEGIDQKLGESFGLGL